MNLNSYLSQDRVVPTIVLSSGLELSIQASFGHYCSPRNSVGPWELVEIGYPSRVVAELLPYIEGVDCPTESIYPWVPIEVVESIIRQNGGFYKAGYL